MTLAEMKALKISMEKECKELEKQIEEEETKILEEKRDAVQSKFNGWTDEQRSVILSYFKHTCKDGVDNVFCDG